MTVRSGVNKSFILGIIINSSKSLFLVVLIKILYAPLAFVSLILLIVLSYNESFVVIAITGVFLSIKDIVPCFSSPAA